MRSLHKHLTRYITAQGVQSVVEIRGGGGQGGGVKPPKCARKCANFRNLKANVQILDRKTPQMVYPISPTGYNLPE